MSVVAIYSMKGGVGKTTAAVNLSYLAAAAGRRALLWDLDPQAASSFAFRVRPRITGFGRKSLESGHTLAAAIKATDYDRLDLLPADFAYRKLDRLLEQVGDPERVMTAVLDRLGRDYDVVFLDCPAGFSLVTEGVFAAADAVLVPTIPTVFSMRTLMRLVKWGARTHPRFALAPFFSMVDRRKALHRRTCEWFASHPGLFLSAHIPYASIVEEMAVRRMPLGVFAAREPAAGAFAAVWQELDARLDPAAVRSHARDRWAAPLQAVASFIARLEPPRPRASASHEARSHARDPEQPAPAEPAGPRFVHTFDTDGRLLQQRGFVIVLREGGGRLRVLAGPSALGDSPDGRGWLEIDIDSPCAVEILSGALSPLDVLERRLGQAAPLLAQLRHATGQRAVRLVESSVEEDTPDAGAA
jgi:chromosome partitioning protein